AGIYPGNSNMTFGNSLAPWGSIYTNNLTSTSSTLGTISCSTISGVSTSLSGQPCILLGSTTSILAPDDTQTPYTAWDVTIKSQGGMILTADTTVTVPNTGIYLINYQIAFNVTASQNSLYIYKNGVNTTK